MKRRPVIAISNNTYHRVANDMIVVAMTSNPAIVPHSFQIASSDLVEGSLNHPGTVRADKIYTLAQSIVVKKFGKVSAHVVRRIRQTMKSLTES